MIVTACKTSPEDFIESSRSDDQTDVLKITLPRMDITNILSKVKYKLSVIHWLINLTFSGSSLVNQSRVLLNVIFIFPEQRRKRGFREDIPEMRPGLGQCVSNLGSHYRYSFSTVFQQFESKSDKKCDLRKNNMRMWDDKFFMYIHFVMFISFLLFLIFVSLGREVFIKKIFVERMALRRGVIGGNSEY